MNQERGDALRFLLDVPSSHEPRRFKVRPVAAGERGAVEDLLLHAPGVSPARPPAETPAAAWVRLGAFDEMRVLRALVDLRAGSPAPDCCFVELMVIDPRYRRAGFGAHLFGEIEKRLLEAGAARILLEVEHDNPNAARFWTRMGFVKGAATAARASYEKRLV